MGTFLSNNVSRKEAMRRQEMHERNLARAKPVLRTRNVDRKKQREFDEEREEVTGVA